ncbi:ABC transporter ATP-binding protein [Nitrosomonas sp.]|uniref:ABC transporter ATP-binding protein n=1 Tax=Nitrosomonas sp. TaxID=42353 RepID=UPI0025D06972|nr:ABC transporter ATP-binding protein [Nitrosomonas sp.]
MTFISPETPLEAAATQSPDAIKISRLVFSYPGKNSAAILDIPYWQIRQGERIFLHGPSGSGKSTLLNLLAGILTTAQGSIEILGQNLSALSTRQRDRFRARRIGIVFQQFNLIPYLNVFDNVRLAAYFGNKENTKIEQKTLQLFAALGLDRSILNKQTNALSVGQQQRVAIARALINSPEILIADEPTSALDNDARAAFMQLLTNVCRNQRSTLIFVSHDTSLAQHFQRIVDLTTLNHTGTAIHAC